MTSFLLKICDIILRKLNSLKWKLLLLVVVIFTFFHFYSILSKNSKFNDLNTSGLTSNTTSQLSCEEITIAITICGNSSLTQGIVALKSALALTECHISFVIMTDKQLFPKIEAKLNELHNTPFKFTYRLLEIQFPERKAQPSWRKLFKECASQRLFLPNILAKTDAILYIDTDVLLLSRVEEIWSFFRKMNSSQFAAMSFESEDFSTNWYHRFSKHSYYKPYGVNSGVMLMNLTRMRQFNWNGKLEPILLEYKSKIIWGDQDIINILFSSNPEKLFLFGCNWNYRPDHCVYSLTCKQAEKEGVKLLHGNRGSFITEKQPEFKAIFSAFRDYDLEHQKLSDLVQMIQNYFDSIPNYSNCSKMLYLFLNSINKYII